MSLSLLARIGEHASSATHIWQRFSLIRRHVYAFNLQSRDAPPHFAESRYVRLSDVYSLSIKCILHDGELTSPSKNCRRNGMQMAYVFFTNVVFYRFRRCFSTRILRPYHQSNRATREGRHFYVSGETSRRLQGKLHEKRRRVGGVVVTPA